MPMVVSEILGIYLLVVKIAVLGLFWNDEDTTERETELHPLRKSNPHETTIVPSTNMDSQFRAWVGGVG